MARNDLTVEFQPVTAPIARYGTDEIGEVAEKTNLLRDRIVACVLSYEEARGGLREMVAQIQKTSTGLAGTSQELGAAAGQTSGAVQQVSGAVQQMARGAQEQSTAAQISNQSVEQLLQAIEQVAAGAQDQARSVAGASETTGQ